MIYFIIDISVKLVISILKTITRIVMIFMIIFILNNLNIQVSENLKLEFLFSSHTYAYRKVCVQIMSCSSTECVL